jgi:tRNA pseudouridine38-40 synthase
MLRLIYSSEIIRPPDSDEIHYVVRGRSFLRYMVRKIVGTLIDVGKGRLSPDDIPQIFELRDRSRSGPTVPPEGLYLVALDYPDPTDSLASSSSRRRTVQQP